MLVFQRLTGIAAITALATLAFVTPVHGQDSLALVQPSSTLVATGTVVGAPLLPQGPGALTTTYSGGVGVGAFNPSAAALTIDTSSTAWTAAVSGNWMPMTNGVAGSEPANYGAQAAVTFGILTTNVDLAIRDAVLTISGSPTVTLTQNAPGTYTFPANQNLTFLSGAIDYRDSLMLVTPARFDLTGQSATNSPATTAILQNLSGTVYSLSYPINVTINSTVATGVTATVQIQGTIVAQGTLTPVPEPTLVLSVCLGACGAVVCWRRKRSARDIKMAKSSCTEFTATA